MSTPLRFVVVGAGNMGMKWIETIQASDVATVAAVVDLQVDFARTRLDAAGLSSVPVAANVGSLGDDADALVNTTIPEAHHAVTSAALLAGLPVLSEKPAAATLAEALSLAATSDATGRMLVVSQSRRLNPHVDRFKQLTTTLGAPGILTTEFHRAPHFGGFRDEMESPLLLDMAIHPFDTARYLLDDEPIAVYADEYNPGWSWYRGDAAATAIFEMRSGARYIYTGSWASPGNETSWNGSWRAATEGGTALWDGDSEPTSDAAPSPAAPAEAPRSGIDAALHQFVAGLATGIPPRGEVHENLLSLAMVEAALLSSRTTARVEIGAVLQSALDTAIADEAHADTAALLRTWTPATLGGTA